MPELWFNLLKTLVLCAIFSTVASLHPNGKQLSTSSSFYKSQSIDTTVFLSDSLVKYVKEPTNISNKQHYNEASVKKTQEQPIKTTHLVKPTQSSKFNDTELSQTIRALFRLDDRPGLVRINPSEEMLGDEPGAKSTTFVNSELPHAIKVQRSPDGKLHAVLDDSHPYRTPLSDKPLRRKPNPVATPNMAIPTADEEFKCADNDFANKTFCKKVTNYPNIDSLRAVLSSRFASYFNLPEPDEIGTRMDNGLDSSPEEFLCSSQTSTIYPQWGETVDKGKQIIVNNEEFKQGVRIEQCTNAGKSCKYMESLMNHYVSECKQHYTYRVLASLTASGDAKNVKTERFRFESCCKCTVHSTLN